MKLDLFNETIFLKQMVSQLMNSSWRL